MREIKFRAKTIKDHSWVYGYYEKSNYCGYIRHDSCGHKIIDGTLGQFSGLYDRDGNELYEGDIIALKTRGDKDAIDIISFFRGMFGTEKVSARIFSYERLDCKVIGNIYDNPELIKR